LVLTVTFNSDKHCYLPMKIPRSSLPAGLLLAALGATVPAHATEYWTSEALLKDFFQTEKNPDRRVRLKPMSLPAAEVAAISKKLGVPVKQDWNFYIGVDGNQARLGYALLDNEIGLHEPIDFGVHFGLGGAVERVEIRAYREAYGDAVRSARFRRKFVGKTPADPIVAGRDVDIISGATLSSKAMALGVKRDTLVLEAALKNGL
jgi:hypothetical protein